MAGETAVVEQKHKWEGKATVEVKGATADQVWAFMEDFCNQTKWLPGVIDTCYQVEGEAGKPGLVRYSGCSHEDPSKVTFAKEKLLDINPIERYLSYEVGENNMGFKSYVATIKVFPILTTTEDGHAGPAGCKIEWLFSVDPMENMSLEGLSSGIKSCLQLMGQKMEEAVVHLSA